MFLHHAAPKVSIGIRAPAPIGRIRRPRRPPAPRKKPRPMAAALDESSTTTYAANYSSSSDAEPASTSPTSTIPESRGRSKIVSLEKSAAGPLQQSD